MVTKWLAGFSERVTALPGALVHGWHVPASCLMKTPIGMSSAKTRNSVRRTSAFEQFEKAAASYAKQLPSMAQEDESSEVYDFWFYASLGEPQT